ncbi:MAG: xylose isomerase [Planctomycetaceae bacterium]|nr:xylose isomerase [Planctomycetaceae bacterium]MBP62581.1 xylose isomerase [Planctomycetaceae bacterium]
MMQKLTRRKFVTTSSRMVTTGIIVGRFASGESAVARPEVAESRPLGMKLSLSVRVAETMSSKDKSAMTLEQLIRLAKDNGYQALCMRASQAGIHTPQDVVREMSGKIRVAGLQVSMVTGDTAIPRNDQQGPECLRNITPYLDLAETFGADLIRVCMKKDRDIRWAQKACDEARERNVRLAHQSHCASLFETVEGSLSVLKKVARQNFGIIYEPANWMLAGQDYSCPTIRKLEPYLFNVYVQNHHLNPESPIKAKTWTRGEVGLDPIGLWDKGGVNFREVFTGLQDLHYSGYVTVHQAFANVMPIHQAVSRSAEYLKPLLEMAALPQ